MRRRATGCPIRRRWAEERRVTAATSAAAPVLVTGATGFLGSHLVPLLLEDSEPVRVLARQPAPDLAARGVEVVVGDVV
ncbi:MAG: NAD-dependent epimerase/dehydratase family protein [Acidobacteria bacterium]|nr:NAD-dependent epimerase/dehydratase family protein [Acidobacteriota bacterium]